MANITLILGGIRSGKSAFAENFVLAAGKQPIYLATGEYFNEEMRSRIEKHRARRDGRWINLEQPLDILAELQRYNTLDNIVLVDCLTVWLGNLMHYQRDIENDITLFVDGLKMLDVDVVLVASEVGLSIVPDNQMARHFADYAGTLNQAVAAIASNVYFIAAGLPLKLKG